jgi:aminoglycoside phosphotransferase (APT) family kinase protein
MAGNPMPAAEVDVTADLVRLLLAGQHPDLAHLPVEFLANGRDNVMFRVGEELVARLPRRGLGAQILVHEQRWLPLLAPRLPLPVPYPERTGHPAHGYPWPWSIVPYLPGEPIADTDVADPHGVAAAVGGFPAGLAARRPASGQHPGPRMGAEPLISGDG